MSKLTSIMAAVLVATAASFFATTQPFAMEQRSYQLRVKSVGIDRAELAFHDPESDNFIRFEVKGVAVDSFNNPTKRSQLQRDGNALVGSFDASRVNGAKDAERENSRLADGLREILATLFPVQVTREINILEIQAPFQRR